MRWTDTYDEPPRMAPCTLGLILLTVGIYLVQMLFRSAGVDGFTDLLGLSVGGLMRGHFWLPLSYLFLHGSPMHLLMNMLMLYILGSEVERSLGRLHFLILYFVSGILGGLGWALLIWPYGEVCVGASGAIFGLLGAFAALYPQREVTLLVFFVFPITMRAWVLAVVLAVVQLLIMMSPYAGGVAYSAHLAGGLAGLVYVLTLFRQDVVRSWWRRVQANRDSFQTGRRATARARQRVEMDALLDKVAQQGLHSLTPSERRQLEKASAALRGRF
jgi:membrane associated rhomboid family serine protease